MLSVLFFYVFLYIRNFKLNVNNKYLCDKIIRSINSGF